MRKKNTECTVKLVNCVKILHSSCYLKTYSDQPKYLINKNLWVTSFVILLKSAELCNTNSVWVCLCVCAWLDNMRPVQLFYSAVTSGSIQFPPPLRDSSLTSAGLAQLQTGRQPARWADSCWSGSGERHWPGWPQRRSTLTRGTNTLLLPTEVPFRVWTQVPLGTKREEQERQNEKCERQNERNNVLGIISYFGVWTLRW